MHYDYEAITAALRDVRLPKAAWTHQAHVAAGLWFVWHHGIDAARILVPAAIRHHNAAVGTVDTPTSGYHETLTQLYLSLIDELVREWTGPTDDPTMAVAVVAALDDRRIPLRLLQRGPAPLGGGPGQVGRTGPYFGPGGGPAAGAG